MTSDSVLQELQTLSNPNFKAGLSHFGITSETALGIKIPELRQYAKKLKPKPELALQLWQTKVHEARLLAIFITRPKWVTEAQMENWVSDFNSWDICDQACILFARTPFGFPKALEWSTRAPEYEKRAAFALMACLAVHDKKATDEMFIQFFPVLEREANDSRNFVKKAINWALRQIGKKNIVLNQLAINTAQNIKNQNSSAGNWIAADALRELTNPDLQVKLKTKADTIEIKKKL